MDNKQLAKGDWVKVTSGPLEGAMCRIVELASEKADVQIFIFGGERRTEAVPTTWLRRATPDELPQA